MVLIRKVTSDEQGGLPLVVKARKPSLTGVR